MMKITYLLPQSRGAFPRYTAALANAVSRHAEVVVLKPSTTTADEIFAERVRTIDAFAGTNSATLRKHALTGNVLNDLRSALSYRAIKRIFETRPDVVHDPSGFPPLIQFFSASYGIDEFYPLVITQHGASSGTSRLSNPLGTAESVLQTVVPTKAIARTIVHSERAKTALERRPGDQANIEVIPHGVYNFLTECDYRERPEEDHCLLLFGYLSRGAGVETLAEAVRLVSQKYPDVNLIIAGTGPLSAAAKRVITRNHRQFECHDYDIPNERVGELFSRAALVVLPYQGMQADRTSTRTDVLATTYAFGKPVIETAPSGGPAVTGRTDLSLVVPPGEPMTLANTIVRLFEDDDLRQRLAKHSQRQADRVSWDRIAKRHVEVYGDAIHSFHSRRFRRSSSKTRGNAGFRT